MERAMMKGRIYYSEKINGSPRNYGWAVRFDLSDGFLGITQFEGETVKDRVLLSPAQMRQLVEFVAEKKSRAA
jgi:hypothetical protein